MKTPLTIQMEETLYYYCRENGDTVVEEVTMPEDQGIVDTLACRILTDSTLEWRCYELKVTKADFRSQAKLSFVGHLNYFVLPESLYEMVAEEIPSEIGVLVYYPYLKVDDQVAPGYLKVAKKARRQELQVNETALIHRLITAQAREVGKAKQTERGIRTFSTDQLYTELKRRQQNYDLYTGGSNYYNRFIEESQSQAVEALKEELEAARIAYFELEKSLMEKGE